MEDFLLLDNEFTAEEKLIRDAVRQFVDKEVIPVMGDACEEAKFPLHFIQKFADLGLFGLTLPSIVGGHGKSAIAYGLVCQELERGDSSLRSFLSVQNSLCLYPIHQFGSEAQRQKYLPLMIQGKLIACFGLTERDAGSDPGSLKTEAKKVSGGWVLNGSKQWITNAILAGIAIIWAKTPEGIRAFIVEKETEGFSTKVITHKMSLRTSMTAELSFKDCFIPDENLLPGSSIGLSAALKCLTEARYGIAWGAMGAAMHCYETALDYCKNRKQFHKALASFQLVQKDLVTMFLEIEKTRAFNLRIGQLKDEGKSNFVMVSLAKLNACKEALKIARSARNLLGANGITLAYPVIRHMANLEAVSTYEGTDNIHHLIAGKYLTGLDAIN